MAETDALIYGEPEPHVPHYHHSARESRRNAGRISAAIVATCGAAVGAYVALSAAHHIRDVGATNLVETTGARIPKVFESNVAFSNSAYSKVAPSRRSGTSWPTFSSAAKTTLVDVQKDVSVGQPTEFLFGANTPMYLPEYAYLSNDTYTKMATAGVSFLRWPGGSVANKYLWDDDYRRFPYFEQWRNLSLTNMSSFARLCGETGAVPLIQLNAALPLVNGSEAAATYYVEQHEAFLSMGLKVAYYEFGNENYGSWEPPYGDYDVDGTLYGTAFVAVAEAMKSKFPYVKMGVAGKYSDSAGASTSGADPARRELRGESSPGKHWMERVLSVANLTDYADWVSIHEYFLATATPSATPVDPAAAGGEVLAVEAKAEAPVGMQAAELSTVTDDELWSGKEMLSVIRAGVEELYEKYAPDAEVPPLALTEFNIAQVLGSGCGALLQFINTLWHVEILGEIIKSGDFASALSFSWADYTYNCSSTSRGMRGDYGMLSHGSDVKADGTPQAQFYSFALYELAFGSIMLNSSTPLGSGIKSYASKFAGGEIGLIVVNENDSHRTIEARGITSEHGVEVNGWLIEARSEESDDPLASDGLKFNGNVPLKFPLHSSYEPYTLEVSMGEALWFDMPPYSAAGLVAYES